MSLQWQKIGHNLSVLEGFNKSGVMDKTACYAAVKKSVLTQVQIENKEIFSQCEVKNTRQSLEHSTSPFD